MHYTPELLAPAGNWDCVRAAAANGADAVYFGLPRFNARIRADNFTEEEMPKVVEFCHQHGVKAYVAFNTLIFTNELEDAASQLRLLNAAGVDAIIVQDIGLVRLAREITPSLAIHASTQMTITSPEGARFAGELGVERVVLARELSLREIEKFGPEMPLEIFVHGALCVAYSGQCLTSESLGLRSANRGECAQACRMPYELIVDGIVRDLGDRRYLLSPQDLAAVNEIPVLLKLGICSFKIEGRLKSAEYVAAVCQVYRKAIDAALETRTHPDFTPADLYQLEMTFSRGLYSGWLHGVNHQELVSARYAKKRGPFAGVVTRIGGNFVELDAAVPLKPGDGIVFDTGGDTNTEQGGRIWQTEGRSVFFQRGCVDFTRVKVGDRVWKTDDPALNNRLRKSFAGRIEPRRRERIDLRVSGRAGDSLVIESGGIKARSALPLSAAHTAPLTTARLQEHLGRFGDGIYELGKLRNEIEGAVILPIAELNRLRREFLYRLDESRKVEYTEDKRGMPELLSTFGLAYNESIGEPLEPDCSLSVLCRTMEHFEAAIQCGTKILYIDFEDIRRCGIAVEYARKTSTAKVFPATPRIQKAGENGFFKVIEDSQPDGVLIRNLGALEYFASKPLVKVGDFSLNVANPITATVLRDKGLERLAISYDLNIEQVVALLEVASPGWFELTIHQHIPMFHMEHCVFAAFMSGGKSFLDCGRPCEKHRVHLRDRVGIEHPLRADVGCRNTLFNATAQSGAGFFRQLRQKGLRHYRIELLEETSEESRRTIRAYQSLLADECESEDIWRQLGTQSRLGVTHGTFQTG